MALLTGRLLAVLPLLLLLLVAVPRPSAAEEDATLGGERDAHGCLSAAGYSWCETIGDCVREWEEEEEAACPPSCGPGRYYGGVGGCEQLTVCNATELEVVAPSAGSDRVCKCHRWASWAVLSLSLTLSDSL